MDEFKKEFCIDERIESYKPFFDHGWASKLFALAGSSEFLGDLVYDLTLILKGTSITSAIPSVAVDVAEKYIMGFTKLHRLENSLTLRLVEIFVERAQLNLDLTGTQKKALYKEFLNTAEDFFERTVRGNYPVPATRALEHVG